MKSFTYWEDLEKPGIRVNSGKIKPGKWQKNIKTWDSGSWKTWEMGKMTWENLGKPGISTLWGRGHPAWCINIWGYSIISARKLRQENIHTM